MFFSFLLIVLLAILLGLVINFLWAKLTRLLPAQTAAASQLWESLRSTEEDPTTPDSSGDGNKNGPDAVPGGKKTSTRKPAAQQVVDSLLAESETERE